MKRVLSGLIGLGLLVALIIVFEQRIGWDQAMQRALALPAWVHAAFVGLLATSYLARAARMQRATQPATTGQFAAVLRLSCFHVTANTLLPARAGEAAFPWLMYRYFGVRLRDSFPTLVWLRLFDLHCLFGAGLLGVTLGRYGWGAGLLSQLIWLAMVPTGFWLLRRFGERFPRRGWVLAWVGEMLAKAPRQWRRLYAWTVLSWYSKFLALAAALMLMVELPLQAAAAATVAGELSFVLPVHGVAGAGTYEGALVGVGALWGAAPDALLAAAVDLHLLVLLVTIGFGLAALLLPAGRRRAAVAPDGLQTPRPD
ncbi:MAG: lysylphosphatidylglycerol synthase domain-containing protein [Abyssibacter sp.]|uniref:lysylphosphatidylglycerol synthase domain-containing protein n=1 Tax=Abyssibacter sp. TaxID=2320200 RepID=UPI00321A9A16